MNVGTVFAALHRRSPMPLHRSWLVQRLLPPQPSTILGMETPFAFGGGLRNGGLSSEAMSLLRDIFSFDYMGAAEFEFGAVPEALQGLAKDASELHASALPVDLADVPPHWRDKTKANPGGRATIYVLCRRGHIEEVTGRIKAWATSARNELKEPTNLTSVLRPDPSGRYVPETCGWLELNNGFFFFTDPKMWRRTCELFGVHADQTKIAAAPKPTGDAS